MIEVPEGLRTYYHRYVKDESDGLLRFRYTTLIDNAVYAKMKGLPEGAWAGMEAKALLIKRELIARGVK